MSCCYLVVFQIPSNRVKFTEQLYFCEEQDWLDEIRKQSSQTVIAIGHNPELTDFVNQLTNGDIENVTTAAFCSIQFHVDSWDEIDFGSGVLEEFTYPRMFFPKKN